MIVELTTAMANIRLIPDTSKLEDLIAKTEGNTDAKVMALRKQAIELLAGGMASQEEVDALADALETAMKNANKPSGGGSSSGGHKGSCLLYTSVSTAICRLHVASATRICVQTGSRNSPRLTWK